MIYRHGKEINHFEYFKDEIKRNGGIMPCFVEQVSYNKLFTDLIKKYADKFEKPKILYVGCGKAFDSIYLSYFYKNIEAIDIDNKMVKMAREHNEFFHGNLSIHQQDAFDVSGRYNIIVLDSISEYTPHDEMAELLKKCYKIADYIIISAVTHQPSKAGIINPHVYTSPTEWKKMIKQTNGKMIEVYGIQYPIKIMNIARYYPPLAKLFHRYARVLFMVIKGKRN